MRIDGLSSGLPRAFPPKVLPPHPLPSCFPQNPNLVLSHPPRPPRSPRIRGRFARPRPPPPPPPPRRPPRPRLRRPDPRTPSRREAPPPGRGGGGGGGELRRVPVRLRWRGGDQVVAELQAHLPPGMRGPLDGSRSGDVSALQDAARTGGDAGRV